MAVTVHIPGPLREFTGGRRLVTLSGPYPSIGDALLALGAAHPGVRDRVMNEQGQVRAHVNVFVGGLSIKDGAGLATPLPDGAEVHILPAVSGG